jgi:hypothetical protein
LLINREYAARSKTPRGLADGLMLVFQYPAQRQPSRALPGDI